MRTREDALRSVRRYVASALGAPPWRVRMEMDARFKRPLALVSLTTAAAFTPSGVDTVAATEALTIQLFPETGATGTENRLLAERAAELIVQALTIGVVDANDHRVRGYREAIPLWAYADDDGNPLPVEGEQGVATRRFACDYLRVLPGWSLRTMPEAPDDQLYAAVCDLRVQWFRNARVLSGGQILESVEVIAEPDTKITV